MFRFVPAAFAAASVFMAAPALAAPPTPQDFATKAAQGDMMEVSLARQVLGRSHNGDVRAFAQRMVDDHTKSGNDLKQVAAEAHLKLPAKLDSKFQGKIDKVLSSHNVDKAYIGFMTRDHREDVSDFSEYAAEGTDASLKAFAAKTLPVLEQHKDMADRINAKL